jgi:hypothetical protein
MRSFDYARTTPEAQRGLPVLVVRFAVVFMARTLKAARTGVNREKRG